ncbi:adenylyltransferase/cytidyltransferase family protein [Candidatus Uhrbacteria bacterium]|nr:adenylyltransferase/cytidyltransferase family protein [Candidatus Uhrbacteria bacterium]
MKTVLAFGVFDLLHPGHLAFLRAAKKKGDRLIIAVTPDIRVKKEKGAPPFFGERERAAMVAAVRWVDRAVVGDRGRRWTLVRRLRPDVICVGYDQRIDHPSFLAQIATMPKKPRLIRLPAMRPSRYASSRIKIEVHRRLAKRRAAVS